MDILFDDDLDNNNNLIPLLNNDDHNHLNPNVPLMNVGEENINNNMENIVRINDIEAVEAQVVHVLNADNAGNEDYEDVNQNEGTSNENNTNDVIKIGDRSTCKDNSNRNQMENGQDTSLNLSYSNTKKSKKRKRHYNVNKNKKWNKSFKRQKSTNTTKSDTENVLQNSRNKHIYTKVPKIIFNNKQAMHRGGGISKFFLPDKRPRKDIIVPPTKFLLGGNISDPLNLNSLQDEALVSMTAVTPKSSPITTPPKVEVIIPPNIYDPLHLLDPVDSVEYEKQLVSPLKARRLNKQRSRKKKIRKIDIIQTTKKNDIQVMSVSDSIQIAILPKSVNASKESSDTSEHSSFRGFSHSSCELRSSLTNLEDTCKLNRDLKLDLNTCGMTGRKRKFSESGSNIGTFNAVGNGNGNKKLRRFESKDKIVSPVIPQPGAWKRPPKVLLGAPRNRIRTTSLSDADNTEETNSGRKCDPSKFEELKQDGLREIISRNECSPEPIMSTTTINDETINSCASTMGCTIESNKYQFGNYAGQYCGLQNLIHLSDVRLTVFLRHAYLFKDKDILDIGCNVGHMTIAVARRLSPKSIVGVDIDKNLIARARRNLSMFQRLPDNEIRNRPRYRTKCAENVSRLEQNAEKEKTSKKSKMHLRVRDRERYDSNQVKYFPLTFPICFGGVPNIKRIEESPSASPANSTQNMKKSEQLGVGQGQDPDRQSSTFTKLLNNDNDNAHESTRQTQNEATKNGTLHTFPDNVFFRTLNYAVTDELQMASDKQQYDLILCLSLTKWIHLNFGDTGLKMTFRRMFNQLRPGGKLILEAQNWASYKKRKKLTPTIYNNYKSIEFFPNNFHEYLLSPEVGFSHSYTLGVPRHAKKGFYRPIQLYIKGDFTPSQVRWSDTYHPQTPYEPMMRHSHYVDPMRIHYGSHLVSQVTDLYKKRDTPFYGTHRYNTPSHGISSTSRYYNPLETDSYLPSYDNVVSTRHYCFASPLYSTVWSPPTSGRRSASQTPLFGSIRRVEAEDQDTGTKHVYLTPRALDGGGSSRSIEECTSASPQRHVYAISSSRSIRESDLDMNTSSPKHVYAFQ